MPRAVEHRSPTLSFMSSLTVKFHKCIQHTCEHTGTQRCSRAPKATSLQAAFEKCQCSAEAQRGKHFPGDGAAGWLLERSGSVLACTGGKFTRIPHPPSQRRSHLRYLETTKGEGGLLRSVEWPITAIQSQPQDCTLRSFLSEVHQIKISQWSQEKQEACERQSAESGGFHGRGVAEGEGMQTSAFREIQ